MGYHIGSQILVSQKEHGWGAKVIEQLSKDLRFAFPQFKGFSPTNLKYMRLLAESFTSAQLSQYGVDRLPWFHLITILVECKEESERLFYIEKTLHHGWSRNVLSVQIETKLHKREGKAITNFKQRLEDPHSELAQTTLRNPYIFDFLSLGEELKEKELEDGLIKQMEKFLLELGEGFAFVGRQYHLQVEDQDFYLDLLFYHIKLRSYVVVELKVGGFKPEHVGKMNFYLAAVDDRLKQPGDNPSIGLILCRSKVGVVAEYALRDMSKPIGLAEYRLAEPLPADLKNALPTIEEIETKLSVEFKEGSTLKE